MNERVKQNVKTFLNGFEKQAQDNLPVLASRQMPAQYARPRQESGGSWLGTLGKLGLLGGLGYGAYKFGPSILKALQGEESQSVDPARIAREAGEAEELMQGHGGWNPFASGPYNNLPSEIVPAARNVMQQVIAAGGSTQDAINKIRDMGFETFGLPEDESWWPLHRGLPLEGLRENINRLKGYKHGDPEYYARKALNQS